jgi:hypothetical protein
MVAPPGLTPDLGKNFARIVSLFPSPNLKQLAPLDTTSIDPVTHMDDFATPQRSGIWLSYPDFYDFLLTTHPSLPSSSTGCPVFTTVTVGHPGLSPGYHCVSRGSLRVSVNQEWVILHSFNQDEVAEASFLPSKFAFFRIA